MPAEREVALRRWAMNVSVNCMAYKHMAHLRRANLSRGFYKHWPPDGGQAPSIAEQHFTIRIAGILQQSLRAAPTNQSSQNHRPRVPCHSDSLTTNTRRLQSA